jgi:hypothetical protein
MTRQRDRELFRTQRVAFQHGEERIATLDLLRRSNKCRHAMTTLQGEIDQLSSGVPGRAEDEDPHPLETERSAPA